MVFGSDKSTSFLAKLSIFSSLGAFLSIIIFSFFVLIGLDLGIFVVITSVLFILSLLFGFFAILHISIFHKYVKGYLLTFLAILLSGPPAFVIAGVWMAGKNRAAFSKKFSPEYNLRLLGKELIRYAESNGCLPDAKTWCDDLIVFNNDLTKENFIHPRRDDLELGECNFAFNKNLSGKHLNEISDDAILVFEADGGWNLSGAGELLNTRYKEHGWIYVVFVDGRVRDYWYYEKAIRDFGHRGASMFYVKPRWHP